MSSTTPPTGGRLSQTEREAAGLSNAMGPRATLPAPSPARPFLPVAPGVGATLYGDLARDIAKHGDVIRASEIVCLHTAADASDPAHAAAVRAINPAARVWLAIPGNYLVRKADRSGINAAVAEIRRCAKVALDMGAELFEINGEGESSGRTPGDWIPADPAEAQRLARLAVEGLEAARDVLGDACALGWTSHDMPSFRLPWGPILSRVDLHSPQHYPSEAPRTVKQSELAARIARSRGRWEVLVERGEVDASAIPYGARWAHYGQGWGQTRGAITWGLCEAPVARLWACPGSWSAEAVPAIIAARRIRSVAGCGTESVEGFQRAVGLTADGAVGPLTLAAAARG